MQNKTNMYFDHESLEWHEYALAPLVLGLRMNAFNLTLNL